MTGTDAERDLAAEPACIEEITKSVLLLQANSAAQQRRPLGRGTHVKGVCARAEFEVFGVTAGRDPDLAARLAKGIFAKPGVYPAVVRFGNADPKINSDFKPDVRSLSFSVNLYQGRAAFPGAKVDRQEFSLQNAPPLPINDARAFLAVMKVLTASNPARRSVVAAVPGQVESAEGRRVGSSAVAPNYQGLPATSVLEQRTVSPRADRRGAVFGYSVPD